MKRRPFVAALAIAALLPHSASADSGTVVVFAAASLREAFEAAAPAFAKQTGFTATFSFAGSDTLLAQIKQGAPADVFASANPAQMKAAADAGLLDGEARAFAHNRLVVIVPKDNPAKIAALPDLSRPGVKIVLAAAHVPIGTYARDAFRGRDGKPGFPADFSAAVERNVVSNELDVKAVATKIALGEGDAGIVYATDVTPAVAGRVTTIAFPRGTSSAAIYPIAVLKGAPNAAGARAFVAFVLSPAGQAFLKTRGFAPP